MLTMLLNGSPSFCPAIKEPSCDKSKTFFLRNYENKFPLNRIPFCKYRKTKGAFCKAHLAINQEMPLGVQSSKGIGIINFFEGKNIFITGTTGLFGKVLVEKILRSTPVGKIFVLVKADDREAAMDRLVHEVVNTELFGCLRELHGKYYEELIREKVIPIVGNICEPNLGMDSDSAASVMEQVNVIIASAAITTLNERYDLLLDANVSGPQRLMTFAKKCKNLHLLVHVSTAYVNGEGKGIILEEALIMGENRRREINGSDHFCPELDVGHEMNLALTSRLATTRDMKRLGLERARLYGWYNAYQMSKGMAEMVIHETRGDVPVLIIRPSALGSCSKEPLPGWIQGNRMFDPLLISYAKGQLPAFLGSPDAPMDIIPLDIVVNATIAAIAKHGSTQKPELNIYQMASSVINPLRYSEFFDYIYESCNSEPLLVSENNDLKPINYFENFDDFSKFTRHEIARRIGAIGVDLKTLPKQCKAQIVYAENLCKMYEFLGFFKARFHAGNTQKLLSEMSKEEQINFEMDVTKIEWRKYLQEVHIPGLRKHVLNQKTVRNANKDKTEAKLK